MDDVAYDADGADNDEDINSDAATCFNNAQSGVVLSYLGY